MANFLAIEWDGNEARVAIARRRGREMIIDDAFSIPLEPRDPGQTFAAPNVGARVAAELTSRNIGKFDTLVAVGRKDIELRTLSVPPAPADEMPDVVRMQALRQFSALGEDWPLDYIPLNIGDEAATSVLAATLSPDHIKQIRATLEVGGLVPRRMVLRPMAAASLLSRQLPDAAGRCRLMIDMLSDEADLTVLMGEKVVFLRTARLSSHGVEASATVLLGEIRRTIVAAQNQLGGQRVEYIIVCGNPHDHAALVERLARELSLPVECFDPFAALPISDELRHRLPENHGRFAPLLGMLVDEAAGTPHAIDFLNPRKRPPPKDRRQTFTIYGSIAAGVALLIGGAVYYQFYSLGSQLKRAQNELNLLDSQVKPSEQKSAEAAEIDKFAQGDVVWLNELHRLSQEKYFPSGEDVMLTQLGMAARVRNTELPPGGGMTLDAVVKDVDVVDRITSSLSDERHVADNNGPKHIKVEKYPYSLSERVVIYHPDADLRAAARPTRGRGRGAMTKAPSVALPGNK